PPPVNPALQRHPFADLVAPQRAARQLASQSWLNIRKFDGHAALLLLRSIIVRVPGQYSVRGCVPSFQGGSQRRFGINTTGGGITRRRQQGLARSLHSRELDVGRRRPLPRTKQHACLL